MNAYLHDLHEMMSGPGTLRFFVQPAIALLLGLRDGRVDSALGRRPFGIALVTGKERSHRLAQGLRAIVVPLCLAVAASLLFQYLILTEVRVASALLYALVFVALPYAFARGLANRGTTRWRARHPRPA